MDFNGIDFFAFVLDVLCGIVVAHNICIVARMHHFFHYHYRKKAYSHSHNNQSS